MAAQRIDLEDDPFCIVFVIGGKEYKADSLVFSSIVMDKTKGEEDPPKEVIVAAMRECLDTADGLNEHQLFGMSVRLTKAMAKAGNG